MTNEEIVVQLASTYKREEGLGEEQENLITLDVFKTALDMVAKGELEVVTRKVSPDAFDKNIYINEVDGISGLLHFMADCILINNKGEVNHKTVMEVRNYGYKVYPGDADSFGWLTGCVDIGDKVLVFG